MSTQAQLENWFTHHPPQGTQISDYVSLRNAGKEFARLVNALVPDCPEKKEAIKRIRAAVMWANAGIACNGPVSAAPRDV